MDNKIATLIRIDEELYEDIKIQADIENRSINKEIEYILRKYIEENKKQEN